MPSFTGTVSSSGGSISQNLTQGPIPKATAGPARRCTLYANTVLLVVLGLALSIYRKDVAVLLRGASAVLDQKNMTHNAHTKDGSEAAAATTTTSSMPGRFPRLDTDEFRERCPWTSITSGSAYRNCTVFMTPSPDEYEGISQWNSEVVMSYMLARMAHCRLYIDYGPDVDIHSVLVPAVDFVSQDDTLSPLIDDWRVPDGFVCRKEEKCITERFEANFPPDSMFNKPPDMLTGPDVAIGPIPRYRLAMRYETGQLWRDGFEQTVSLLPGFLLETGMACSLGRLFELSPEVARYEDDGLFTEILPMLRNNPVVAVYIRADSEETEGTGNNSNQGDIVDASVRTALELERKYLAGELMLGGYGNSRFKPMPRDDISMFVWLVISDDESVKERIVRKHDEQSIRWRLLQDTAGDTYNAKSNQAVMRGKLGLNKKLNQKTDPNGPTPTVPTEGTKTEKRSNSDDNENEAAYTSSVTRNVLVTDSRGTYAQLKKNGVSTKDFAAALVNWYLIGESDAVVASSMSTFGVTAALRTARHVYDPLKYKPGEAIQPEQLVYEGSPKTDGGGEPKNSVVAKMQNFCSTHRGYKGGVKIEGQIYDLTCAADGDRKLMLGCSDAVDAVDAVTE